MKILYSCSNRPGSGIQMERILEKLDSSFKVRIAGHYQACEAFSHIDWTLDALRHNYSKKNNRKMIELFGYHGLPDMGFREAGILLEDISDYYPDLVITDGEPIVSHISKALGLRLWYVNPLHILDGFNWGYSQMRYRSKLDKHIKWLKRLPEAEKYFVYSPFGDFGLELKEGYEWVAPYYEGCIGLKKSGGLAVTNDSSRVSDLSKMLNCVPPHDLTLFSRHTYNLSHLKSYNLLEKDNYKKAISNSNWLFTTGETSFVADGLYNGCRICISPNLEDPESLLNSIWIKNLNLGDDVGQIEFMEDYGIEVLENSYSLRGGGQFLNKEIKNFNDKLIKYL